MGDTNIPLVDDGAGTYASMQDIFLDLRYTAAVASDGPGGWELSGRPQDRLALLDYPMPRMGGLQLC